jgi:hypothetical protein
VFHDRSWKWATLRRIGSALCVLSVFGCSGGQRGDKQQSAKTNTKKATQAATRNKAAAGAKARQGASTKPESSAIADVNLLRQTAARVWVSSWVGSDRYAPWMLIDGDLNTAWNGKAGQLVGATIGFELSERVTVANVALTVGFTAKDKKLGDLFAKNHRIKKITISRQGKTLGTFSLDANSRALQTVRLPANTRGGSFELRVDEVVAGSKPKWREICVTELRVSGLAPTSVLKPDRLPTVWLGKPPAPGSVSCAAPVPKAKSLARVRNDALLAALLPGYKHSFAPTQKGYVIACNGAFARARYRDGKPAGKVVFKARKRLADGRLLFWVQVGQRPVRHSVAGDYDPHGFIAVARLNAGKGQVVIDSAGAWAGAMRGSGKSFEARVGGKLVYGEPIHISGTGGGDSSDGLMLWVEDGDRLTLGRELVTTALSSMGEVAGDPCEWDGWMKSKLETKGSTLKQHVRYFKRRSGGKSPDGKRCKSGRIKKKYTRVFAVRDGRFIEREPRHPDTPF